MLEGSRKAPKSFLKRVVSRGLRTLPFSSVHYPKASLPWDAKNSQRPPELGTLLGEPAQQALQDLKGAGIWLYKHGATMQTLCPLTPEKKRRWYSSTHLSESLWPTCTQKVKDTPQGPYLTPSFLTTKAFICSLVEPSPGLPSLLSPYVSSCLHCSHMASSSGYLCHSLHLESSFFMWFNPVHLDLSS